LEADLDWRVLDWDRWIDRHAVYAYVPFKLNAWNRRKHGCHLFLLGNLIKLSFTLSSNVRWATSNNNFRLMETSPFDATAVAPPTSYERNPQNISAVLWFWCR